MPQRVASSDGVDLALHHFGGTGPTLMICHASGFHANCYRPMMAHFTAHFDVWGMDFRGHGASTPANDGSFAWTGFAQDLLHSIDHIGADTVKVFGHSMGGASTLLAEKMRPGLVEAAWLYEPIIFPPSIVPRNSQMAEAAKHRRSEFPSKADAMMRYASRPPFSLVRADALAAYVNWGFHENDDGTVALACKPEYEAATFNGANTYVDDIAGLNVRAVIAHGSSIQDPSPAAFAGPTAEALPNGELLEYSDLTHLGPFENPARIANAAMTFLTSP